MQVRHLTLEFSMDLSWWLWAHEKMNLSMKKSLSYCDLGFGEKKTSTYNSAFKIFTIKQEE